MLKATYSAKNFNSVLNEDATYIIIGGTGGIGRSITKWMVSKGAKNIVIVSRSEKISEKVGQLIQESKELGANVIVRRCDVSDNLDVIRMVKDITTQLPPVRGLIHSAMVLDVSYTSLLRISGYIR
jgi:NAD(P)-dependent dehydrogenase (short-subunit alcohol dehydrogenase family)